MADTYTVHLPENPEPSLGGRFTPPTITPELAERSVAEVTRIKLGDGTVNSCNPGIGDVDGDGLDEIAIPFNRGEQDVLALYRGDGTKLWETTDIQWYHRFYDDDHLYRRTHWHYQSPHRHLLTRIRDIDGDGRPEVIVGLGPIWILDAATGEIKNRIDLDGMAQVWDVGHLIDTDSLGIAAGVNHHQQSGSLIGIGGDGSILWRHEMPGMSFEDKLICGDLTGDGLDEFGFSMADAERFEVRNGRGELLWAKHVPTEIGEDSHVDDMVFARVLDEGTQLLTSTGGCLFMADGTLVWSLDERIEHGQKVACAQLPGHDGPRIYLNSKTGRKAWLIHPDGRILWEYANFTTPAPGGRIVLTTAGDWIDWSDPGSCEMAQAEIAFPGHDWGIPDGTPLTLYLTVLSPQGEAVAIIPYTDLSSTGNFNGAMCAIGCHCQSPDRKSLVVILHNSGEMLVIRPA